MTDIGSLSQPSTITTLLPVRSCGGCTISHLPVLKEGFRWSNLSNSVVIDGQPVEVGSRFGCQAFRDHTQARMKTLYFIFQLMILSGKELFNTEACWLG